jgi:hypothetical protein
MCAPKKLLPVLAIAGLAVATGGLSVGASTAATTGAVVSDAAFVASSQASTLSNLGTALKVGLKYANTAAPLIGASGLVYSGQVQKGILEQQAAFSKFQASQESETYALRKDQRRRELARALGKQRALYGTSGVALENTPTDILASTARSFSEDDFYDRYGTSGRMVSANISADNLRMSGEQAQLGGLLNAEMTLAQRGTI